MAKFQKLFVKLKLTKYLPEFPVTLGFISLLFYTSCTILFFTIMSVLGVPLLKIVYGNFADSNWQKVEGTVEKIWLSKKYETQDTDLFDPSLKEGKAYEQKIMYSESIQYSYKIDSITFQNNSIYPYIGNWRSANSKSANEAILKLNSKIKEGKITVFVHKKDHSKSYILKLPVAFSVIIIVITLIILFLFIWIVIGLKNSTLDFIKTIKVRAKLKLNFSDKKIIQKRLISNSIGLLFLVSYLLILNNDAGGVNKFMYRITFKEIIPFAKIDGNLIDFKLHEKTVNKLDTIHKTTLRYKYTINKEVYENSRVYKKVFELDPLPSKYLDTLYLSSKQYKFLTHRIDMSRNKMLTINYNRFDPRISYLFKKTYDNAIENYIWKSFNLISFLFSFVLALIIFIIPLILILQQLYRIVRDAFKIQKIRN